MTLGLGLLAALASAAPRPASPRAVSEDRAFSVALERPWRQVTTARGRAIELETPAEDRLLVVGEWRDGATSAPSATHQARLKGAELATLPREGPLAIRFARVPDRRRAHLRGFLQCEGDRYLFDVMAGRDEDAWRLLETLQCAPREAARGQPLGETGWSARLPRDFQPVGPPKGSLLGLWHRVWQGRGEARDDKGRPIPLGHEQYLRITSGSEIWTPARPWPDACGKGAAVESATQELRGGKTGFRFVCAARGQGFRDNPQDGLKDIVTRSLVYVLVYGYDGAVGQASFFRFDLTEQTSWLPGLFYAWVPPPPAPDAPTFDAMVRSLERDAAAPSEAPGPSRAEGAIPLLR